MCFSMTQYLRQSFFYLSFKHVNCDNPFWAQLYRGRITLFNGEIAIQRISDSKTYSVIHRIEIYPVDNIIRPSNNRGPDCRFTVI